MINQLIEQSGIRMLCIAEIRGQLSLLNELAREYNASLIIHTGSFGFFDGDSISKIHESYLRHIVAFSPLLNEEIVNRVSELSKASGEYVEHSDFNNNGVDLKQVLQGCKISELMDFVNGEKQLEVPVYTIYGMVEDSTVLNKFRLGIYSVKNLYLLDENSTFRIKSAQEDTSILLTGIGGSLAYHKLFHHGTFDNDLNKQTKFELSQSFVPIAGDPGNVWITMLQLGQLIKSVKKNYDSNDVRIFVTHPSPSREGLLGHLSVYLKMDYTISNGLHFLYPSSFNELTICPSFEYYKSKFSEARFQLSSIWKNVKTTVELISAQNPKLSELLNVSLEAFDRIPVINVKNEEIIPLTLSQNLDSRDINSNIIRLQNDSYYVAFQNMWHFNLCDISVGSMMLNVENGRFKFEANSLGFDFNFKKNQKLVENNGGGTPNATSSTTTTNSSNNNWTGENYSNSAGTSPRPNRSYGYRGRGSGFRSRGRGGGGGGGGGGRGNNNAYKK